MADRAGSQPGIQSGHAGRDQGARRLEPARRSDHQGAASARVHQRAADAARGPVCRRLKVAVPPKTRVLVVDDSAIARRMLVGCLRGEADIEVIGEASDAFAADELIARWQPDLITLDIGMPAM